MLVVNCPKCMTILEDAVKTTGFEGRIAVRELIELIAEAMELDGATPAPTIGNQQRAGLAI
jgi:Fe-S oxidoreductase